jgi:hypothetical protein
VTWKEIVAIGRELPEALESTSYGRPALKVRGKFFAGFNTKEDAVVLKLANVEEQGFLIEAAPKIYYITDHYRGWPSVLARPARLTKKECRTRLEYAWALTAPKTLVKRFEESKQGGGKARRDRK